MSENPFNNSWSDCFTLADRDPFFWWPFCSSCVHNSICNAMDRQQVRVLSIRPQRLASSTIPGRRWHQSWCEWIIRVLPFGIECLPLFPWNAFLKSILIPVTKMYQHDTITDLTPATNGCDMIIFPSNRITPKGDDDVHDRVWIPWKSYKIPHLSPHPPASSWFNCWGNSIPGWSAIECLLLLLLFGVSVSFHENFRCIDCRKNGLRCSKSVHEKRMRLLSELGYDTHSRMGIILE